MQQLINFFIRNKNFLFFLLLFTISLFLTIQSHSYHKSKFINSANFLTGGVYESVNNINQYFNLKEENLKLQEENNNLKSLLFNSENKIAIDTTLAKNYRLTPAQVYKNSYSQTNNYLTINKGTNDSVKQDFGVISSKGIVGIIDNTSNKYARVMSILNSNSRINAKIKKTNHFGTLKWNGKSPNITQLTDIQGLVPIAVGDTITTSGNSSIFPKDILIGKVISFTLDETEDVYTIDVELFNDMTNIAYVYIIENKDAQEIELLNQIDE
ncbi:rod shape-determining protein MreC [Pontimicrobium sp. IMCC45349]|uniref:rod shape-determining protein MreC n=1 Tax=Pontimicrobium sp. IMCC45349 TaxID=3391574 RepID=UPI0039A18A66